MAEKCQVKNSEGDVVGYLDPIKGADDELMGRIKGGDCEVFNENGEFLGIIFDGTDNISGITIPYDWHIDILSGGAWGAAKAGVKNALSQGSKIGMEKVVESMYRGAGAGILKKSVSIASKKTLGTVGDKIISSFKLDGPPLLDDPALDRTFSNDNLSDPISMNKNIEIDAGGLSTTGMPVMAFSSSPFGGMGIMPENPHQESPLNRYLNSIIGSLDINYALAA